MFNFIKLYLGDVFAAEFAIPLTQLSESKLNCGIRDIL